MSYVATDAWPHEEPDDVRAMRGLARAIVGAVIQDLYLDGGRHREGAMRWLFDDTDAELIQWRECLMDLADIHLDRLRALVRRSAHQRKRLEDLARRLVAGWQDDHRVLGW